MGGFGVLMLVGMEPGSPSPQNSPSANTHEEYPHSELSPGEPGLALQAGSPPKANCPDQDHSQAMSQAPERPRPEGIPGLLHSDRGESSQVIDTGEDVESARSQASEDRNHARTLDASRPDTEFATWLGFSAPGAGVGPRPELTLMRPRRYSSTVGWATFTLLAVVGFAAFGSPGPTADEIQSEASSASIGHMSGAYAGLAFAYLAIDTASTAETAVDSIAILAAEFASLPTPTADPTDGKGDSSGADLVAGWLSEVEVRALVSVYFDARDVNQAVRVAWCESRFDPAAINLRTGGVGLFQHLPQYWEERAAAAGFAGADPTDPEASVAAAAWAVYDGGGWDVFACRD